MPVVSRQDLLAVTPQLIVAVFGMLVLLIDAIWPRCSKRMLANLTVLGFAAAGGSSWLIWSKGLIKASTQVPMQGLLAADGYATFFNIVLAVAGALSAWLAVGYLQREGNNDGEYYALLLFTTLGGMVMAASVNLICIFIGLEILSISLYILCGYQAERRESDESAMKYFLLGAFASAFLLYGVALVYGATGSTNLPEIARYLGDALAGQQTGKNMLLRGGIAMILVGFGFKVAVVPFHIWAPDVYEGAPTSVTAFMSVTAKIAGFAAFLRVISSGFQDPNVQLEISAVLASIAALTMLVGNVVAVVQTNLKRLLAYSGIAQAGYILTGLVAVVRQNAPSGLGHDSRVDAVQAVLFYSLVYTIGNLGVFGVLLALRKRGNEVTEISDLNGTAARHPGLAALMTVLVLSLAGMPPLAGFFGKLLLVQALISMNTTLVWLIVLFAMTSVVSFYYYLGIVRAMYMEKSDSAAPADQVVSVADGQLKLAIGLSALGTVVFGLWANGALTFAHNVALAFFNAGGAAGGPFNAMR